MISLYLCTNEMLTIFRKGYWLAEPETKFFYGVVMEYVEGWNRSKAQSVTNEALMRVGHTEANLKAFYEELERRTDILRTELAQRR